MVGEKQWNYKYQSLSKWGFDSVLRVDLPGLTSYSSDYYLYALHRLSLDRQPSIIVFPSYIHFEDIAARLAEMLGGVCIWSSNGLTATRNGQLLLRTLITDGEEQTTTAVPLGKTPVVAVAQVGTWQSSSEATPAEPVVETVVFDLIGHIVRTKALSLEKMDIDAIDLVAADVVIAGGRGVDTREGWALLEQFAHILGAKLAGSRAAFLNDFISEEQIIGITNKRISPRLYLGIGISGSSAHLFGIKDAELVVCVNKDETAPIFGRADLGIVADLYDFLPRLIELLKAGIAQRTGL